MIEERFEPARIGVVPGVVLQEVDRLDTEARERADDRPTEVGLHLEGRPGVEHDVDHLAHSQIVELGEAQPGERALHRRALHVHDPRLEPDEHTHFHLAAASPVTTRR